MSTGGRWATSCLWAGCWAHGRKPGLWCTGSLDYGTPRIKKEVGLPVPLPHVGMVLGMCPFVFGNVMNVKGSLPPLALIRHQPRVELVFRGDLTDRVPVGAVRGSTFLQCLR